MSYGAKLASLTRVRLGIPRVPTGLVPMLDVPPGRCGEEVT